MKIAYLNEDRHAEPPGHLPASRYVRRFWSPLVGVTAVGCYVMLTEALDDGRATIAPVELAGALGLESPGELTQPIAKLAHNGIVVATSGAVLVRRTVPTLREHHEHRLPPVLREAHRRLRNQGLVTSVAAEASGAPGASGHEEVDRARMLALSLLRMGTPPSSLENEMHRRRLHPALAFQASVWAIERSVPPADPPREDGETGEAGTGAGVSTSDQSA